MTRFLVLSFIVFLSGMAVASDRNRSGYAQAGSRGEQVFVSEMHTISAPTEKALVLKATDWMRNFTKSSSYEACANICRSPTSGEFSAILSSSHSQIGCGISRDRCPEGFVPVDRTVHSHPMSGNSLVLNDQDRQFMRVRVPGRHVPQNLRFRADPRVFSKDDFDAGPGYLITEDEVLFQDGKNVTSPDFP